MIPRVYYCSTKLIVISKLPSSKEAGNTIQNRIINLIGDKRGRYISGGLEMLYRANEIWHYDNVEQNFIAYKSRGGWAELLSAHLASSGIKIIQPKGSSSLSPYQFKSEKDLFLFNLKYGY